MGVFSAKEVKFTTALPLLREKIIELKLIDGLPVNNPIGMPFLFWDAKNICFLEGSR